MKVEKDEKSGLYRIGELNAVQLRQLLGSTWHDAEKELPENGQVVVTVDGDYLDKAVHPAECMEVCTFYKRFEIDDETEEEDVFYSELSGMLPHGEATHWMPIPAFPPELTAKMTGRGKDMKPPF